MEKKPYLHFLNARNRLTLLIGFGVAFLHFVITYSLQGSTFASTGNKISVALTLPSYVLMLTSTFLLMLITGRIFYVDLLAHGIPYILISSLFYGVVAAFLASRKKKVLLIGLALIVVLLLCSAWIFIMAIIGQINA